MKRKLLMITIILTCCLSGCGKNTDVVKNISTEVVQEETVYENTESEESVNSAEIATEQTTEPTVGAQSLDNYIGWWIYYYADDEWLDVVLNHVDGQGNENEETIYATVIQYDSSGEGSYTTDCETLPVDETNTAGGGDTFSYTFTPDGNNLKITIGYPEGAEFEGVDDEEYVLEKEDDENLGYMERDIKFMYDSKLAEAADTSGQNTENQTSETASQESESKYTDSDLITAAEGFLDTAIADSVQRTHTSYEVDSATDITRNDEGGTYSVKFLILFDGQTKEYLTVRMMDTFNGLEYSGVN